MEDGSVVVVKQVLAVKTKGNVLIIDGCHRVLASRELGLICPGVFYDRLPDA
jgi:hypothetical protein